MSNCISWKSKMLNWFHASGLFCIQPGNSWKPRVFSCFQDVQKETSGMKYVKLCFFFKFELFCAKLLFLEIWHVLINRNFGSSGVIVGGGVQNPTGKNSDMAQVSAKLSVTPKIKFHVHYHLKYMFQKVFKITWVKLTGRHILIPIN